MEVVHSVIFSQLNMKFEARLEKILKQLKLLRFPVKRGHRCAEWLWQYANSVGVVMKVCRIVVICQLLKGQQNFVWFNCRRGILAAELRLTGWAVLFLFYWKCTGGAVCDFLVNSCHHIVAIGICSVAPVTTSWPSSGTEFSVIWLWKMPASGWESLRGSSSFVPWLVLNAFRDVSGAVPE